MNMKNSFTFKCNDHEQKLLISELSQSKYITTDVPHTIISVNNGTCNINLYKSGKLLIQGKGAEEWVTFILEPNILKRVEIGYEAVLDPASREPHMGIDESGKGDFFGPLVIASAYVNKEIVDNLESLGVRDSKSIKSDRKIIEIAKEIKSTLTNKYYILTYGVSAYNKRYEQYKNLNKMLAWGHAQAIESLLDCVPECPRALSDKFGPDHQIQSQLKEKGRSIILEQKTKAESDPAVAAASILARAHFLYSLKQLEKKIGIEIPKGCSEKVQEVAKKIIKRNGPSVLLDIAKCHFKTTDQVLASMGFSREDLKK